jgi:hypothetical protein
MCEMNKSPLTHQYEVNLYVLYVTSLVLYYINVEAIWCGVWWKIIITFIHSFWYSWKNLNFSGCSQNIVRKKHRIDEIYETFYRELIIIYIFLSYFHIFMQLPKQVLIVSTRKNIFFNIHNALQLLDFFVNCTEKFIWLKKSAWNFFFH